MATVTGVGEKKTFRRRPNVRLTEKKGGPREIILDRVVD